ncbi:hypothetical protein BGX33_008553 [Mortierella sp. NVP41]|nr:hypothetical protein BGX33_008553 [Mortierella sp. NVP41]
MPTCPCPIDLGRDLLLLPPLNDCHSSQEHGWCISGRPFGGDLNGDTLTKRSSPAPAAAAAAAAAAVEEGYQRALPFFPAVDEESVKFEPVEEDEEDEDEDEDEDAEEQQLKVEDGGLRPPEEEESVGFSKRYEVKDFDADLDKQMMKTNGYTERTIRDGALRAPVAMMPMFKREWKRRLSRIAEEPEVKSIDASLVKRVPLPIRLPSEPRVDEDTIPRSSPEPEY